MSTSLRRKLQALRNLAARPGTPGEGEAARAAIGRLLGRLGEARERLTEFAIEINGLSYRSVRSILDKNLDRRAANKPSADSTPIVIHPNIRGSGYYN